MKPKPFRLDPQLRESVRKTALELGHKPADIPILLANLERELRALISLQDPQKF